LDFSFSIGRPLANNRTATTTTRGQRARERLWLEEEHLATTRSFLNFFGSNCSFTFFNNHLLLLLPIFIMTFDSCHHSFFLGGLVLLLLLLNLTIPSTLAFQQPSLATTATASRRVTLMAVSPTAASSSSSTSTASTTFSSSSSSPSPLLIRAARGETVERTPVWMMRQAGRHMQAYRDLCKTYPTFRQRSEIPEVAIEISLQPHLSYQTDGCILFSDILTPLPGMGCDFVIDEAKGPVMAERVTCYDDLKKVSILQC
jgi:hypothetical protein